MLWIRAVKVLDNYLVRLTLTNGDVVERDLSDLVWGRSLSRCALTTTTSERPGFAVGP